MSRFATDEETWNLAAALLEVDGLKYLVSRLTESKLSVFAADGGDGVIFPLPVDAAGDPLPASYWGDPAWVARQDEKYFLAARTVANRARAFARKDGSW